MALPIITTGCRTVLLLARRCGSAIVSGSRAERRLRGVRRLLSLAFASMDASPVPFPDRSGCSLAPGAAPPGSREYATVSGIGEGLAAAGKRPVLLRGGMPGRSPP